MKHKFEFLLQFLLFCDVIWRIWNKPPSPIKEKQNYVEIEIRFSCSNKHFWKLKQSASLKFLVKSATIKKISATVPPTAIALPATLPSSYPPFVKHYTWPCVCSVASLPFLECCARSCVMTTNSFSVLCHNGGGGATAAKHRPWVGRCCCSEPAFEEGSKDTGQQDRDRQGLRLLFYHYAVVHLFIHYFVRILSLTPTLEHIMHWATEPSYLSKFATKSCDVSHLWQFRASVSRSCTYSNSLRHLALVCRGGVLAIENVHR